MQSNKQCVGCVHMRGTSEGSSDVEQDKAEFKIFVLYFTEMPHLLNV